MSEERCVNWLGCPLLPSLSRLAWLRVVSRGPRAPAASNPPTAEGGNQRVSRSWRNRALSGCWRLGGDPRDLSQSSWRCPEHHLHTVSPTGPMCSNSKSGREAAAAAEGDTEPGSGVGRGTSRSLFRVPAQTPSCVLGLPSSTRSWPLLRRSTTTSPKQMGGPARLESSPRGCCVPVSSSRGHETRTLDGPRACPERRHLGDLLRDLGCPSTPRPLAATPPELQHPLELQHKTTLVPDHCLPVVESDLGVPPHFFFQNKVSVHRPLWAACDVHIVKEREQMFAGMQPLRHCTQASVLSEAEKEGH